MAASRSPRFPAASTLAGLGLIVLLSAASSRAAAAPGQAAAAPGQAAAIPAPAFDRVAAARQAYAGAADPSERRRAAVKLGILLLQRATHHPPPANDRPPAPDSAASPAPPGSAVPSAPPSPPAREDLAEAERLFREVVAGGGQAADEGEGGLLAALLARGPGGAAAAGDELQRLRQGGRSADAFLCVAMRDLLRGNSDAETTLAASDLLNDHVHANLPAAPYLVSHRVSKPEQLSAPPARYTEEARKKKLRGSVALQAVIDREGHVADVLVIKPGPFTLTEAATKAVRAWTYRPALLDGKPVPVCFQPAVGFDVQ